ncbi:hypothetical protein SAMN06265348_113211 [Pedobacter westerhofensis]|uniref:Uncharacterized protein n=1 Tax=Pedobacter westerhofensis TaxID=425512 RepID=A0A521FLL4_9SPHI|nr:hypothetical protein [Pedobacter westerhofensis]SMO97006.1 hypothetical protein SAMN06265348_113211 [Pedobacter westerhofensis]
MEKDPNFEFERLRCMMLKAYIVNHMTAEVKTKISAQGYTPTEVATAYVLKTYKNFDNISLVEDPHRQLLNTVPRSIAEYHQLVYNETGDLIIDIVF